jgi:hypothetical protein
MVRSHALYPIELRAHRGEIASSNYNGNKIISANLNRCIRSGGKSHAGFDPCRFPPNAALAVKIGGLEENRKLHTRVKVSGPAQNLPGPAFYPHVLPTR